MAIELQSVTFESPDPRRQAEFWGAMLNRPVDDDADGILLSGTEGQVGIRFAAGSAHGRGKNRLHLHLADGDQQDTIAACLKLGARLLGNGHVPENSYAVLADVVGDEFCVIEAGNPYLAGCGPLGEVTCAGTRAVGLFWSETLAWPVVWDEGEETAIQSQPGGTKIAWSGLVDPGTPKHRQFFVLTFAERELEGEVARLMSLGATDRAQGRSGQTTLKDPDGNEFVLRTS